MIKGDKVKIHILASGSKGNMTYIKTNDQNFFIDAGISYLKVKQKMLAYQQDIQNVDTIILTHEHYDHTMGLKMILKQGFIKTIYLTHGTYQALTDDVKSFFPTNVIMIKADQPVMMGAVEITPFMVSHDALEPVGFLIKAEGKKIVSITDTGYVDQSYEALLSDADLYIVEANHHPTKLMNSPRPFLLKKRILSEKGHLSNEDACWLMNQWIKTKTSIWVVAHMSEDCNDIIDVEEAIVATFDDPTKVILYYASNQGLPVIDL
jgi:phosphoribosyl 1,2-cyclic phosphodiesterase